jgi:hypothetical protein
VVGIGDRLDRPVQFVAGKGGVGRTAVSCALALRSAAAEKRTLLLEVDAPDSAAALLGVAPCVDVPKEIADNLWLCRMTPSGSLREYALMVLKFRALYNLVFENRMVKYLLRSIPSMAEVTMLGKTWFHTTEHLDGGEPKYERIIVDAPATGHAITFLSVARIVADVAPKGVLEAAAARMAEMVESKEQTALHVVTLPEEMPVNEGLDLVRAGRTKLHMSPGVGFVNRLLPPLASREGRAALVRLSANSSGPGPAKPVHPTSLASGSLRAPLADPHVGPYLRAAALRFDREDLQRENAERFAALSGMPTIHLSDFELSGASPAGRAALLDPMREEIDRGARNG